MIHIFRFLLALLALVAPVTPAHADQQDIAAATRGVVRVVLVATDGTESYFVGHGTGFAVTPDTIITNAHVVELTRQEKTIVLGIIPSQGGKSFGGKVIAFSPGNDLALIKLQGGTLPVSTFYSGAPVDGQAVVAIGYPGSVDRAQGLQLNDMIAPLAPVSTRGNISGGRSSKDFDTILHSAPIAAGNSGGPLTDECGRVIGVNSFGSVSEGADAEFGFAVSDREIATFLRKAGIDFHRTSAPCRSSAQLEEAEDRRLSAEAAQQAAKQQAATEGRNSAMIEARDAAERDVITARENAMALAAALLAIAVLLAGGAGLMFNQNKRQSALWFAGLALLALGSAAAFFFTRPSFAEVEERIKLPENSSDESSDAHDSSGPNMCRIAPDRSRITVSDPTDTSFNWTNSGCMDGHTPFLENGTRWQRLSLSDADQSIDIRTFDPATGAYTVDRYLVDTGTMERARKIAGDAPPPKCGSEQALADWAGKESEIRAILPPLNERLVYGCANGSGVKAP